MGSFWADGFDDGLLDFFVVDSCGLGFYADDGVDALDLVPELLRLERLTGGAIVV